MSVAEEGQPTDASEAAPPRERFRPPAAAAFLGAVAQLGQILVFREIMAVCHGTEVLFGIVLAGHLGWTAAGSATATLATRKSARRAGDAFVVLAAVAGVLLAGQIVAARALAGWGTLGAGEALPLGRSAAAALLVTAPLAAASGAMFVLAVRTHVPGGFAAVYRAESWGAVVAALAFTFAIVHLSAPVRSALAGGCVFALAALWLVRPVSKGAAGVAITGVGVCLAGACLPIDRAAERLRWQNLLGGYRLVEARDTPYGHAAALRRPGTGQLALFHNGSLVAGLEAGATPADARQLADLCAAMHPQPRRALLVGRAVGAFPEQFTRHGVRRVEAVELDPALFALARRHGGFRPVDRAVRRVGADGRFFVARAEPGSYDLIVVSAGEGDSAVVNRYYTVEFFRLARRALADGGVLVVLLPTYGAAPEYLGRRLIRKAAAVRAALAEVFGDRLRAAPVGGILLAAAKGEAPPLDPRTLGRRLSSRPAARPTTVVRVGGRLERVPVPPEDYFAGLYGGVLAVRRPLDGAARQRYVDELEAALADADVAANRDDRPVAVAESLAFGAEVTGADLRARDPHAGTSLSAVLRSAAPASVLACIGGAAFLALATLAATRRRRAGTPRAALLLAAFATGLFGMAMTVALLSAYQNIRGYVYAEIGAVTASFMVGLALGARWTQAQRMHRRAVLAGLIAAMIALSAAGGTLSALLGRLPYSLAAAGGLWALVFAAGFLDGATFTPLVGLAAAAGHDRLAGWIYAVDLLGAGVAALLVGAVWVPLLGVTLSHLTVAAVLSAALVALAAGR